MPIAEPRTSTDFWPRVRAHNLWPHVDEDEVSALGDQWLAQLDNILGGPREVLSHIVPAMGASWPDAAGVAAGDKLAYSAHHAVHQFEADVRAIANTCYGCADHVARAKTLICAYIDNNRDVYEKADEARRTEIVTHVVNNITAMIDGFVDQIRK